MSEIEIPKLNNKYVSSPKTNYKDPINNYFKNEWIKYNTNEIDKANLTDYIKKINNKTYK